MFNVKSYPQGTFSWADCTTTDPAAARKFYKAVLGWDAVEVPAGEYGTYTMFKLDGEDVAGMGEMRPEMQEQGIPSHWMSYITVPDVDAMPEQVKNAGGAVVMPPMAVMESGRMMILKDPAGAQVALWQPKNHIGAGVVNREGAMLWNELQTTGAQAAMPFYKTLFGWDFTEDDNSDYYYIVNNGRMNGGLMPMDTETYGEMPSHWMIYFNVKDIQAALKAVKANGGKALMEINEAPGVGDFVMVSDPAGAMLTLMQAKNPEPWTQPADSGATEEII
jgi:hypothetical protein